MSEESSQVLRNLGISRLKAGKIDFDSLTAEQVGQLFPIRIVPYDSDWTKCYEQEKELIIRVLSEDFALHIAHFGSTSVVGLAAKPTIDILVEVPALNEEAKLLITRKLEKIGYGNMFNAEKEKKMTFGKGYDLESFSALTYHVHIREKGDKPQDETYFRYYLRQNPDACEAYAQLKYALAEKFQFNREAYTQAKTVFIQELTEKQKKYNLHGQR